MFSVALIGPDGAGKTTIAQKLVRSFPLPVKYLYMGVNAESSNVALPTTRLAERLKRKNQNRPGRASPRQNSKRKASMLRAGFRLANRLAEEWYRQMLSWHYRRAGNLVIYDRHFQFDFNGDPRREHGGQKRLTDRLHVWCLAHLYPEPDLVIYLDAPAEVLFARKGEATMEWLEARRQAFMRQGAQKTNFIQIDATQPLEVVYKNVEAQIMGFFDLS